MKMNNVGTFTPPDMKLACRAILIVWCSHKYGLIGKWNGTEILGKDPRIHGQLIFREDKATQWPKHKHFSK